MNSHFLARLFSTAKLPQRVFDAAISAYTPRYLDDFIKNESLGQAVRPLVTHFLEKGEDNTVIAMLRTRNSEVLDQLLASPGLLSKTLLFAVVDIWNLSDGDAAKLGTHTDDKNIADYLLVAAEAINGRPGWGSSTTLRLRPQYKVFVPYPSEEARNQPLSRLGRLPDGLAFISDLLTEDLGSGLSEGSMRSWITFFGLAQNDPDVQLKTVLSSSKILALAE